MSGHHSNPNTQKVLNAYLGADDLPPVCQATTNGEISDEWIKVSREDSHLSTLSNSNDGLPSDSNKSGGSKFHKDKAHPKPKTSAGKRFLKADAKSSSECSFVTTHASSEPCSPAGDYPGLRSQGNRGQVTTDERTAQSAHSSPSTPEYQRAIVRSIP